MNRLRIHHKTTYQYSSAVELLPHTLRLRPREDHELRIENSKLEIHPTPALRWMRDAEGNSIAVAEFQHSTTNLTIKSDVVIQQYNLCPLDFLMPAYAERFPFCYQPSDRTALMPYLLGNEQPPDPALAQWLDARFPARQAIDTIYFLQTINQTIFQTISYVRRDEEGVQSAADTLRLGSGSCRDSANLFLSVVRQLGLAARFVSGYIYSPAATPLFGSTHAWAEVFIPGAGWKGFDSSTGNIVGADHIAVAVAVDPVTVPPVAGCFIGHAKARMSVNVWVTSAL